MRSAPIRTPLKPTLEKVLKDPALKNRYRFPFDLAGTTPPEMVSTGIEEVDALSGGLPRGRITEISGPNSSGRTSLLISTLAQVTDKEEVCALVDPAGNFDSASAAQMGVDLERLLWIRTAKPDIDQTLKAADLLIQGGGFGLIGIDFGEFSHAEIRGVPLSSWFRLQRAVEDTPTILLFIGRETCTHACASLVLGLTLNRTHWTPRLFHGIRPQVEILRSKINPGTNWNHTSRRFFIQSVHFRATANSPTEDFPQKNKESDVQGVSCHEL